MDPSRYSAYGAHANIPQPAYGHSNIPQAPNQMHTFARHHLSHAQPPTYGMQAQVLPQQGYGFAVSAILGTDRNQ
jgi:hypothetical protein